MPTPSPRGDAAALGGTDERMALAADLEHWAGQLRAQRVGTVGYRQAQREIAVLVSAEPPSILRDLPDDERRARAAALVDASRREAEARGERPDSFFARWERVIKGLPLDPPPPDTDTAGRTER